MAENAVISVERIEKSILLIRGHKVILDADLAELYGVETRALVQAVKRNIDRFPGDFMFQLTPDEEEALRSQIVISKSGRGHPPVDGPAFGSPEETADWLSTQLTGVFRFRVFRVFRGCSHARTPNRASQATRTRLRPGPRPP